MVETIQELNTHVKTDLNEIARLLPFREEARAAIANAIGMEQLLELEKFQLRPVGDTSFDSRKDKLNEVLKIAKYAYSAALVLAASPFLDINISGVGFTTASQQNQVAASAERVNRLNAGLNTLLAVRVDALLGVLEQYADDFPLWSLSIYSTIFADCFLSNVSHVLQATGETCYRQLFARKHVLIHAVERRTRKNFAPVFDNLPSDQDNAEKKQAVELLRNYVARAVFTGIDSTDDLNAYICQNAEALGYEVPRGYVNTADSPIFLM